MTYNYELFTTFQNLAFDIMDTEEISVTIDDDDIEEQISDEEFMRKKQKGITKLKKKKRRRKRKRRKHKRSSEIGDVSGSLQNIRNLFPKQGLYGWSSMLALCGMVFAIIAYIMPWLTGETTCIVTDENAPKMDTKIHAYKVYETRIVCFVQIVIALIFFLLITKIASLPNNHQSKIPKSLRFTLLLYGVCIYFINEKMMNNIDKLLIDQAQLQYSSWSNSPCPDSRFVIKANFTTWKQLFPASTMLTFASGVIATFRSVFISQTAKVC